jgi:hypothetical protein
MAREQHRDRTLRAVEDQRRRCEPLAPGAQHIGRADIARPDLPQIARAEQARQDDTKGNRTEQISGGDQQKYRHENPRIVQSQCGDVGRCNQWIRDCWLPKWTYSSRPPLSMPR